ncbi:MAG: helix-turn-helix domain-containing protein [Actinomycetota bacterium]
MTDVPDSNEEHGTIIDAAIRCFERYGPQRTSMSDIAEEAGISRRTLYRAFDDRRALVEQLLFRRLMALGATVRKRIDSATNIEDALVDGSVFSVEAAEADALFIDVVSREHDRSIERFLIGDERLRLAIVDVWRPILAAGRKAGRVRLELSDERIVELIMSVQSIAQVRDDLDREGRRDLFRDLLIPAILVPTAPS